MHHRQRLFLAPQASVAERPSVLPPAAGATMTDQKLDYRLWHHGNVWRWQVLHCWDVLSSGTEVTSAAARIAAFRFCQDLQEDEKE